MNLILDQIETICVAAGGHLRDVVRLRLYVSSMAWAPAAITALQARSNGNSIPFSLVENATLSTWLPGCTVAADAIVQIRPQ
jgi:enamine deaminase RidA (YjgF/YER057c/UK114 family)